MGQSPWRRTQMRFCQLFCSAIQYRGSLPINEVIGHGQNDSEGERLGHITSSTLKGQQYHIHPLQSKYIVVKVEDWWKKRAEVKVVSATDMINAECNSF